MEKPRCLAYRLFPEEVPSNYWVSIKNVFRLLYWSPLGVFLALINGLKMTKSDIEKDATISHLEGFLMMLSVIVCSPLVILALLVTGFIGAVKGRLMSVEIEELDL